jgi:hypothetical protein
MSSFAAVKIDDLTKAKIVHMILNRKTELLSKFHNITPPEIVVGQVSPKS